MLFASMFAASGYKEMPEGVEKVTRFSWLASTPTQSVEAHQVGLTAISVPGDSDFGSWPQFIPKDGLPRYRKTDLSSCLVSKTQKSSYPRSMHLPLKWTPIIGPPA